LANFFVEAGPMRAQICLSGLFERDEIKNHDENVVFDEILDVFF
jgi:hypothetical protein